MRINLVKDDVQLRQSVEVQGTQTLDDLKILVQSFTGIAPAQQRLLCRDRPLEGSVTLDHAGITEGDNVVVQSLSAPTPSQTTQSTMPSFAGMGQQFQLRRRAEMLRRQVLSNPEALAALRSQAPPLASAVNNPSEFARMFLEIERHQQNQQQQLAELDDPNNQTAEKQEKIMEMINRQRVLENRQAALQDYPEAFGSVTMLYIPVTVNGHNVKAFVDSGAQTTIMSPECAERCGIMSLLDKEFGGMARGVGTSKILGRIHLTELIIADNHLMCSFSVIEEKSVDMLLGLDMLKRHQATIDLEKNVLRIAGKEVAFLPESEIPQKFVDPTEPEIEGPSGLKVGARTGTVKAASGEEGSSASTSGSAPPPAQRADLAARSKDEEQRAKVKQLQEITGCSEIEATNALEICDGNVDAAAGMLLS